ncbi:hypothetical protein CBR_g19832 [Chara braunii]|uniref:DUF659 domain-containing protein n=1 Tax=Chara braunii TaxID=69332 RepID=A0A388JU09_CHABU|nr:hypothetical protein CBR_g19832 [Chara braunii]|eukprot:GBG61299.1 hypothetical protein CBR_g19832 [Chara braunii]
MSRSQSRVFEDGGEDENLKAQKKCCVYKYISVGQNLSERFRGNRMLKCVFCGHEFQGNQFVAARHFLQGKGCPEVTDDALVDIHYNSEYRGNRILERIQRFEDLHGAAPAVDPQWDEGGEGEMRDEGEQINVDDDDQEVAQAGSSRRERGKGVVSEPRGQQGQYFALAHVSVRARAGADTPEASASTGKRKEREEGDRPTAAAAAQKRMRQKTITESFTSKWQMVFKKKWLRFVYSQRLAFNVFRSEPWLDVVRHFRDLPGPVKVLWLSENEIADIETIVHTADDVGDDLVEVKAPFYVTGATIMSDGRKSRDARPIVNFLAGGSRGVMLVQTMNREVHVCNKMLSDIGCSGPWSKDIIVRGRAVVRFIKEHGAALHIFRGESSQIGLIYPCETRFASVFAMVERLLAVRSALERTVDGDSWGMVHWDHSVRHLARWVRVQVRHKSWWDSMGILPRIMEPMYDLLRRLDRGGLHMSRVVEWTQDLARQVAEEVCARPPDLAHYIVQRVQARCAHMLESAHAAAHLLCPSRRDLRYFEGVVSDYNASLVREAETYILSQTGFSVVSHDYETACAQLRDFHTRRGTIAWGGRDRDRDAQRCRGDAETYESGCWWSRAPPGDVGDVFGTRAATLHPYPRDYSDSEGHEVEDEPAGPASTTPAADERDEWSDLEDVRRRSGGDDLFIQVDLEEESGGRHGSPFRAFADPSSFSPAMRAEVMLGAEGDEDRTPPGETSAERLDRLDSRRACLMAQRDPRTQELARLAAEDRQRQLGTFTPSSVDAGPAAHTDTPAEVHDTTQREAASTEVSSTGVDVQQGTHESGLAPTEEPRSEPAQHPAVERRPEETLKEVPDVPLLAGSFESVVHMSLGLEDIPTGQSVGVDDIRPSAQAEGIALANGGDGAVAGTVGMSQSLVVRTAVGPVVPHQAPFLEGFRHPAHGGGPVEEQRVGRGACIPPVPAFAPSRTRPEIRHVATPRGSLPFGFMTAEELEDHGRRDLTEIDQRVLRGLTFWRFRRSGIGRGRRGLTFWRFDRSAISRRRRPFVTLERSSEGGRQPHPEPGLIGVSTSARRRDVVATGFGSRGGGGGGSGGDGDDRREGASGATTSTVDPPRTYGLRKASIILEEPDVVTQQRQTRHVPLD